MTQRYGRPEQDPDATEPEDHADLEPVPEEDPSDDVDES